MVLLEDFFFLLLLKIVLPDKGAVDFLLRILVKKRMLTSLLRNWGLQLVHHISYGPSNIYLPFILGFQPFIHFSISSLFGLKVEMKWMLGFRPNSFSGKIKRVLLLNRVRLDKIIRHNGSRSNMAGTSLNFWWRLIISINYSNIHR